MTSEQRQSLIGAIHLYAENILATVKDLGFTDGTYERKDFPTYEMWHAYRYEHTLEESVALAMAHVAVLYYAEEECDLLTKGPQYYTLPVSKDFLEIIGIDPLDDPWYVAGRTHMVPSPKELMPEIQGALLECLRERLLGADH